MRRPKESSPRDTFDSPAPLENAHDDAVRICHPILLWRAMEMIRSTSILALSKDQPRSRDSVSLRWNTVASRCSANTTEEYLVRWAPYTACLAQYAHAQTPSKPDIPQIPRQTSHLRPLRRLLQQSEILQIRRRLRHTTAIASLSHIRPSRDTLMLRWYSRLCRMRRGALRCLRR